MKTKRKDKKLGFTVLELLVVISVIGLLAAVILVSTNRARLNAQIAKAQADERSIADAAMLFAQDLQKWPNGCVVNTPQMVGTGTSALFTAPTAGTGMAPCIWSAADVAKWKGPYLQGGAQGTIGILDPWGGYYQFIRANQIPPYFTYPNTKLLIVSAGPDKSLGGDDNILIFLNY
jgi:general secretion pathway protein G